MSNFLEKQIKVLGESVINSLRAKSRIFSLVAKNV